MSSWARFIEGVWFASMLSTEGQSLTHLPWLLESSTPSEAKGGSSKDLHLLIDLSLALAAGVTFSLPLTWVVVGLLSWALFGHATGLYKGQRQWSLLQVPYEILKCSALLVLALGAVSWFVGQQGVFAEALLPSWAIAAVAMGSWRCIMFEPFSHLSLQRTVVVGGGAEYRSLALFCERHPHLGLEVVGHVVAESPALPSAYLLGTVGALAEVIRRERVDALVVANPSPQELRQLVGASINPLPLIWAADLLAEEEGKIPLAWVHEGWVLGLSLNLGRNAYVAAKRVLDLALASIGLVVTALLLPGIYLGLKLWGGQGPLVYSQVRAGHLGRPFTIHKFRSMVPNCEQGGAAWAAENDPRVTRFGSFLRASRLDELPQFWNVLKGDMSLVGPRPERPELMSIIGLSVPHFHRRCLVKPGLTGWAQVNMAYTASVEDAAKKLEYDLFYIRRCSLFLDLSILLRTVWVMVGRIGSR